ncbi:MAG: putative transcriptional regulator [Alphaproteobacteria bacterium]|jgi:putative transcriptional regulator
MNKPNNHPHDDLIYTYAKGCKDEALNLILSTHFYSCNECQIFLQSAEHLFGDFFSDLPTNNLVSDTKSADVFDRIWETVQSDCVSGKTTINPLNKKQSPLDRYLEKNKNKLQVNTNFPHISETILPLSTREVKVSIMNIDAGTEIPPHTHKGLELTQIISGGFYDQKSAYHAGDLTFKDHQDNHAPKIFDDSPCKCLVVRYGGLKFTGSMGLVYNSIFRLLD